MDVHRGGTGMKTRESGMGNRESKEIPDFLPDFRFPIPGSDSGSL
jgi:hypothetical protein